MKSDLQEYILQLAYKIKLPLILDTSQEISLSGRLLARFQSGNENLTSSFTHQN